MGQEKNSTEAVRWKQINERERYEIEALLKLKMSSKEIAKQIRRHPRTVEREIARGSVIQRKENRYASRNPKVPDYLDERVYLADVGQRVADENASRKGRGLKIGSDHALARHLEQRIGEDGYSPDAAIGEIRVKEMPFRVTLCTRTVYNMIDRGDFLNLTNKDLPVKRDKKKRKYRKTRQVALNNLKGRSIDERPQAAEDREEYGHWEMDVVVGKTRACMLVLTERMSRKEIIVKLQNKTQDAVKAAIDRLERRYGKQFSQVFKTVTSDNGCEFLDSKSLEASCLRKGKMRTTWYYAHPYSAWERGSNENANRLIRRFVSKGTDIGKLTNKEIQRIEHWMNNYPRRIFGYKTANDMAA